jgi:hypothetical protein
MYWVRITVVVDLRWHDCESLAFTERWNLAPFSLSGTHIYSVVVLDVDGEER